MPTWERPSVRSVTDACSGACCAGPCRRSRRRRFHAGQPRGPVERSDGLVAQSRGDQRGPARHGPASSPASRMHAPGSAPPACDPGRGCGHARRGAGQRRWGVPGAPTEASCVDGLTAGQTAPAPRPAHDDGSRASRVHPAA
jgi:hypothetical protein